MKEQDLLESFSGISEELLKRSENNKKTGTNETKAAEKSNAKAGSSWRKLGYIAAVLVLTAGLIILFIHINNKPDSDVSDNGGCCGLSAVDDARRVADCIGIPYYVMDFKFQFSVY